MKRHNLIKSAYEARSKSKIVTLLNILVVCAGTVFILYHGLFVWR